MKTLILPGSKRLTAKTWQINQIPVKKGVFHLVKDSINVYRNNTHFCIISLSFMSLLREIKKRKPAKSLQDMEIPEAVWKPDFDIADRYQGFANELMRIALLGIGGYGFLIKEIIANDKPICHLIRNSYIYLCIGALSLGISLILVLAHRFYSTACLYYQLLIVRSLKRLENNNWSLVSAFFL